MKNHMEEMTEERKRLLKDIIRWYWEIGEDEEIISKRDYEFVYQLYDSGLSIYSTEVQTRLNEIREAYIKSYEKD